MAGGSEDHAALAAEVIKRDAERAWRTRVGMAGGEVGVESLGVAPAVGEIYRRSSIR